PCTRKLPRVVPFGNQAQGRANEAKFAQFMVSAGLTAGRVAKEKRRRGGRRFGNSGSRDFKSGTAGCASCAGRQGHAGRSNTARREIPRLSGCSGRRLLP